MAIQPGTVVWLKSGGPSMTIKEYYDKNEGKWICTWFDGNQIKEHVFNENQLTVNEPDSN